MRLLTLAALLLLAACSNDDDQPVVSFCNPPVTISDERPPSDDFTLVDAIIADRCLALSVAASGCEEDDFSASLWTDGHFALSDPPQAGVDLIFDDGNTDCEAVITTTFQFDLTPYIPLDSGPVRLNIGGTDVRLTVD